MFRPIKTNEIRSGEPIEIDLYNKKKCKCGKLFYFAKMTNGKKMPVTYKQGKGWINHFFDCKVSRVSKHK